MMGSELTLTSRQQRVLITIAMAGGAIDHEDKRLDPYCDPVKPDVFNECHRLGFLRTTHNVDAGISVVRLTDAGRAALAAAEKGGESDG